MLSWILCAALAAGSQAAETWKAPDNPDPQKILDEAVQDMHAGKNEQALAKLVWFHDNALKYDPALSGVRQSFALADWLELAKAYPPAMDALKRARDEALKAVERVDGADGVFEPFNDLASINRTLGDESLTETAFVELDTNRPEAAQRAFRLAEPALIRSKRYELCAKYVMPDRDWSMARRLYHLGTSGAEGGNPKRAEFAEQKFTNEVSTLVALLVVSRRKEEADVIAQKARAEWNDPQFHAAIDSALGGAVPDPWP